MKKINVYPTDNNEPICLLDYLIPESEHVEKLSSFGEDTFIKKLAELPMRLAHTLIQKAGKVRWNNLNN